LIKLFIVWLQLPKYDGSAVLYYKFVEPFLLKHQNQIDEQASKLGAKVRDSLTQGVKAAVAAAVKSEIDNKLGIKQETAGSQ